MIPRREFKYVAPIEALEDIRSALQPFVDLDPFLLDRPVLEYTVRSLYLDTPRFDLYRMKVEGENPRLRIRIRGYDECSEESTTFLEIRRKDFDFVSKDRAPLRQRDLEAFLQTADIDRFILPIGENGRARASARRFLFHYHRDGLLPAALVVYDREAFSGKFDPGLRITFDKRIRGRLFPSLGMLHADPGTTPVMVSHFVLEVKFYSGLPKWVRSMITRFGLRRTAHSKYNSCVERFGVDFCLPRLVRAGAAWSRAFHLAPRDCASNLPGMVG